MIAEFNAWKDPWIPIEKKDGIQIDASIFEVLSNAHEIIAIRASSPSETFGISRLLITIITDMYRPKRWGDIDDIRSDGSISKDKLNDYYELCLAEGASFDIFDEKRPFLQYAFPKGEKPEAKPAANLFDHLPAGNNVPLFRHNSEDSYSFTPARCLQAICAIPFYEKHKRAKKVTTGINGVPPVYFLFNGSFLFETLIISMVPESDYKGNSYGLPIWRENSFAVEKIVTPDILHGLFSSPLKIQLGESKKGYIKEIYLVDSGVNYEDVIWKDPNVAYYKNKDNKVFALKARNARAVWRDLPIVIEPAALSFLSENNCHNFVKEITAYVKISERKGTVFMAVSQFTEYLKMPIEILSDENKRVCYSNAIKTSDDIVKECAKILGQPIRIINKEKQEEISNPFVAVLPPMFSDIFLIKIKEQIDNGLVKLLIAADKNNTDWEIKINDFLAKSFSDATFSSLKLTLDTISDENVDSMILKSQLRKNVIKELNSILKKGGYKYDSCSKTDSK